MFLWLCNRTVVGLNNKSRAGDYEVTNVQIMLTYMASFHNPNPNQDLVYSPRSVTLCHNKHTKGAILNFLARINRLAFYSYYHIQWVFPFHRYQTPAASDFSQRGRQALICSAVPAQRFKHTDSELCSLLHVSSHHITLLKYFLWFKCLDAADQIFWCTQDRSTQLSKSKPICMQIMYYGSGLSDHTDKIIQKRI